MSRFRAKLVQSLHYQEQRVRKSKMQGNTDSVRSTGTVSETADVFQNRCS